MMSRKMLSLYLVICLAFVYVNGRPGTDKSSDNEQQARKYGHEHEHEHEHEYEHQPPHEHSKDCGHPIKEGVEKIKKIIKNAVDDVKKTVKSMLPPPPPRKRPGYEEKDKPSYSEGDKKVPPYYPQEEKEQTKPAKKPEYDNPEYVVKPQIPENSYPDVPRKEPTYKTEESSKKEYEESSKKEYEESSKKEYEESEHHPASTGENEHHEYKGGFTNH